jgi:hypothetical protein
MLRRSKRTYAKYGKIIKLRMVLIVKNKFCLFNKFEEQYAKTK